MGGGGGVSVKQFDISYLYDFLIMYFKLKL